MPIVTFIKPYEGFPKGHSFECNEFLKKQLIEQGLIEEDKPTDLEPKAKPTKQVKK